MGYLMHPDGHINQCFLRIILGTRCGPVGTRRILIAVSVQIFPLIIVSDSREPIFNSRDPNRVPKTPLQKTCINIDKKGFPEFHVTHL